MADSFTATSKGTILTVDDVYDNLAFLNQMLSAQGYKIRSALDGSLALQSAQAKPPDLILLDILMPDMDGYEVCRKLKADERTRHIPVIFVSALSETVDKVKAFDVGGIDYLTKPFQKEETLARIDSQLQLSFMRQELMAKKQQLEQEAKERERALVKLKEAKKKLRNLNHTLELKVIDRTEDLQKANFQLRQEISDRKQAEDQLRLFNSIVVNAKDAVVVTTPVPSHEYLNHSEIIYVNHAFTEMTGYAPEEVIGKSPFSLQSPEPYAGARTAILNALDAWYPMQLEMLSYRKDGTEFWVDINIFPVPDASGTYTHWVTIQRDINLRKQQEQKVLKALEQEKELNELKTRFITTASHEFRTPLATILSSVDLLDCYGHLSSKTEIQEYYQHIRSAISQMTALMSDVLTLNKTDLGKMELKPALLNLDQVCQSLIAEIQLGAQNQYNISFLPNRPGLQIILDEKILRTILTNLLSNAAKYSSTGKEIRLEVECRSQDIIFRVKDNGIGIPNEARQRIFEPFFRANNVDNISGTGLGLSIVEGLVQLHHGWIQVESQVGLGSTFTISLPMQDDFNVMEP